MAGPSLTFDRFGTRSMTVLLCFGSLRKLFVRIPSIRPSLGSRLRRNAPDFPCGLLALRCFRFFFPRLFRTCKLSKSYIEWVDIRNGPTSSLSPFMLRPLCVPRLLSLSTVILPSNRSEDSVGIAGRERKTKTRLLAALSNPFPS
jgi:hypothetical protein